MRKRQKKKLAAIEHARQERQAREANEELAARTKYVVAFGPPTIADLEDETVSGEHFTEFIPVGTTHARCRTLKRGGVFTAQGHRLRAQLLEAEKK